MKMRTMISLLVLPLVAALGCQQGEQQAEGEQATTQMEAASEGMETAPEGEMAGGAMSTLDLAALNNSGITGTATLSHTAKEMTVTLNMQGLSAGETYAAHIHKGTCEQGGPPIVTLESIQGETGTSTTTVAMSELTAMKSDKGMADGEMMDGEMAQDQMAEGEMGQDEMAEDEMGQDQMAEDEMGQDQMAQEMGDHEMMEGQMSGYYIQVHNPDGSPASCANIKAGKKAQPMQ